ncbi:MAG: hypothetical protein Q7S64_00010 [bacterium]|nr:hypothetical protein [bacterium]
MLSDFYQPTLVDTPLFIRLDPSAAGLTVWLTPELITIISQQPPSDATQELAVSSGFSGFAPLTEQYWGVDNCWHWSPAVSSDGLIGTTGNWAKVVAFSLSLNWLVRRLNNIILTGIRPAQVPVEQRPQQIVLRSVMDCTLPGRAGLSAFLTPAGRQQLVHLQPGEEFDQLKTTLIVAMREVYLLLGSPLLPLSADRFRVILHPDGGIYLIVPGNACSFGPEQVAGAEEGYEMESLNVDSPQQQQSLLAGCAALDHWLWQHASIHS